MVVVVVVAVLVIVAVLEVVAGLLSASGSSGMTVFPLAFPVRDPVLHYYIVALGSSSVS